MKIPVPDHLKAILVDDWENVTKNQQLVPVPHPHPVTDIMDDYLAHERQSRVADSPEMDVLEETLAGLCEYFDKSLGRILLYRYNLLLVMLLPTRRLTSNSFERAQYHEMFQIWSSGKDEKHKAPRDTYGPEHLCRLIGKP